MSKTRGATYGTFAGKRCNGRREVPVGRLGQKRMAWTESYHCDVCGKARQEDAEDWWLAWREQFSPAHGEQDQPMLKLTHWNPFLSHSADVKHLCGARCSQTFLDRWMTSI